MSSLGVFLKGHRMRTFETSSFVFKNSSDPLSNGKGKKKTDSSINSTPELLTVNKAWNVIEAFLGGRAELLTFYFSKAEKRKKKKKNEQTKPKKQKTKKEPMLSIRFPCAESLGTMGMAGQAWGLSPGMSRADTGQNSLSSEQVALSAHTVQRLGP